MPAVPEPELDEVEVSMPRYGAKRDANESEMIGILEQIGCSVRRLDIVDLLVGYRGRNILLEVKDGEKKRKQLTDSQIILKGDWRGQYDIVVSTEEAIRTITKLTTGR